MESKEIIVKHNFDGNDERETLLKRIHSISFYMYLTALTSEGCLEVEVITSKGTSYSWMGFEDFCFDVYCINGFGKIKLCNLKNKITLKTLCKQNLRGTKLGKLLFKRITEGRDLSEIFQGLLALPETSHERLFCYIKEENKLVFFENEEKLAENLSKDYPVDTKWEELSDEQINEYLDRVDGCKFEIPYSYFEK